jgi:hypothetical protein
MRDPGRRGDPDRRAARVPSSVTRIAVNAPPDAAPELAWLRRAQELGVPIAPMAIVTEAVERDFYRLAHLEPRVRAHFAAVDPRDPDEDDLEDLAPDVAAWVLDAALLVEVVEGFYEAQAGLSARVRVRRSGADGVIAVRGRPALVAVKRTWAADWSPAAIAARLSAGGGWMPRPAPVLVHDADLRPDAAAARAASEALGRDVDAWCDARGRLARLALR